MSGYTGRLDEDRVSELITRFGDLLEGAGDLGFILTYHAAQGDQLGVMDLAGKGIDQDLLVELLDEALSRNRDHGCTT